VIRPDQLTAFDVETNGAQPLYGLQPCRVRTREAWLTTCAVADWVNGEIVTEGLIKPTVEQLRQWLQSMADQGQYVVCWNAPFDVAWLIVLGLKDLVYKTKWLDGMLLERHAINAPKYRAEGRLSLGLKETIGRYKPETLGYQEDVDFADETPEGLAKLVTYNQDDARHTLWIASKHIAELPREVLRSALIEARSIPLAAEAMVEGLDVDADKAQALADKLDDVRKLSFVKLKMQFPTEISEEVLASPKQLGELLFKTWGLPVVKLTDTGQESTDKQTLLHLALTDERAKLVYDYREAANNRTKFALGTVNSAAYNGDGCVRPNFRIFGTYTGRGTYSSKTGKGVNEVPTGIAIHQWKRGKDFRELIVAPDGCDIVEADFAGQEYRWMAVESGDPTMLAMCMPGEDPHSYMAAKFSGRQYEKIRDANAAGEAWAKADRHMGKFGNLSFQYRIGPNTVVVKAAQADPPIKLHTGEATSLISNYLTTYRAVKKYWNRQIAIARQQGWIETKAGRRVYLGTPDTWRWVDKDGAVQDWTWGHESTAINFPIQGVGADQKYLALLVLRDYLPSVGGRFMMELHDGIFLAIPKDKSLRAAHEIKALLSNLPYKRAWGIDLPIQFPVDVKIGPSWGELKELR